MSKKIKPISTIKARLNLEPNGEVQKFLTQTCAIHMDKYVPYDNGELRTNIDIGDNYIQYNQLYAHYQYKGILYVDPITGSSWARKDSTKVPTNRELQYHTPGTGNYWDKRMVSAEIDDVVAEVEKKFKFGGK